VPASRPVDIEKLVEYSRDLSKKAGQWLPSKSSVSMYQGEFAFAQSGMELQVVQS